VVELIASHANVTDTLDDRSLATIERIVQTIAYPDAPVSPSAPTPIVQRPAIPKAPLTPAAPVPAVHPTPAMGAASSLDEGIAALDSFAAQPFAEPAPVEEGVVPIDALLYRGRAAVERAVQLRDQIRQAGGTPAPELLGELFDLLDLALAE